MSNTAQNSEFSGPSNMTIAIKEGLIASAISFVMFLLYVGVSTYQDINNALVWSMRWGLLSLFVVVAGVARFATIAFIMPALSKRKSAKADSNVAEIVEKKTFLQK